MSDDHHMRVLRQRHDPWGWEKFKRFFIHGLAALLPALLTIAVVVWAYRALEEYVGQYVTEALIWACARVAGEPTLGGPDDALKYGTPIDEWDDQGRRLTVEYKIINHKALRSDDPPIASRAQRRCDRAMWTIVFAKYKLHVIGFLVAIIFVYFVGMFLASLIGRTTWRMAERGLYRVPVIGAIYPNLKQVTDFVLSERKLEFSGVVAVEYPRRGLWSLGLRTGSPMRTIAEASGGDLVTVFIPSSPTPITGYVITVPRKDTIDLALTIDEALRFTISGGVIKPEMEQYGNRGGEQPPADG